MRKDPAVLLHNGGVTSSPGLPVSGVHRALPVPDGLEGQRVDQALARLFGLTRTAAAEVADAGNVLVDGRVWPVFNVADSAIVCGGVLGALLALRGIEFDGSRPGSERVPADRSSPADEGGATRA